MKILLFGYGKMGKAIEKIALERGHEIVGKIDADSDASIHDFNKSNCDAVIEFTQPEAGLKNILSCIDAGIPTVSGTTGWLDQWQQVQEAVNTKSGAFFYASNFSVGVNLFFKINKVLANLMAPFKEYKAGMTEIHHIHKLDAPSGTAITLAQGILEGNTNIKNWKLEEEASAEELPIKALREGEVPGTHIVNYSSEIDTIEIKHEAHSRQGFALGAVLAAEWIQGKQGMLGMDDMLKL